MILLEGCSTVPQTQVTTETLKNSTSNVTTVSTVNSSEIYSTSTISTSINSNSDTVNTNTTSSPIISTTLTEKETSKTTNNSTVIPITSTQKNPSTVTIAPTTSTSKTPNTTKPNTSTSKKPTTTTAKPATSTSKDLTTTTTKPTTSTSKKPTTTTTKKPTTTTTKKPTTTTTNKLTTTTTKPATTPAVPNVYEPLNSNFQKKITFPSSKIDLDEIGIADSCKEDLIKLYELGFIELAKDTRLFDVEVKASKIHYDTVLATYYKLLKIYNGETFDTTIDYSDGRRREVVTYLLNQGLLTDNEALTLYNSYFFPNNYVSDLIPAYAFGKRRTYSYLECIYKQKIQVITTRLFKVIDEGKQINGLTELADVTSSNSDQLDFQGILDLYNLGIIEGDEYGRFNPYSYISLNDFISIITRICYPSRRISIDAKEYNKKISSPRPSIKTYNNIDADWYKRAKELTNLKALYVVAQSDTRRISWEEAICITIRITYGDLTGEANVSIPTPVDVDSEECRKIYERWNLKLPQLDLSAFYKFKESRQNISKKEFAIFLVAVAENYFLVFPSEIATIKPELAKGLEEEEIHFLSAAVAWGLIENTYEDFSQTSITQAEFEKMLIQFAMKFSTFVSQNGNKYGTDRQNVITDPKLLPKNADMFPYILDTAPKEVYEELGPYYNEEYYEQYGINATPKYLYGIYGVDYFQTDRIVREYFDVVLNVDYRTIDLDTFAAGINDHIPYDIYWTNKGTQPYIDRFREYVEYVKENEIIMTGSCVPILPFVTGEGPYFLRCKLEVNIVHSKIENPQVYCPFLKYILGTETSTIRYADIMVAPTIWSRALYVHIG